MMEVQDVEGRTAWEAASKDATKGMSSKDAGERCQEGVVLESSDDVDGPCCEEPSLSSGEQALGAASVLVVVVEVKLAFFAFLTSSTHTASHTMKIKNLQVRPKKEAMAAPCAAEFAAMLACWASTNDLGSTGECKDRATQLQICMKTNAGKRPRQTNSINYHLAKWSKRI
ncbi:unnamed protein product [Jaminaea pallidilutea]